MPKFLNPITITTPSGSAPLIVNSSTVVTNLNADLLDGQHGSFYQNAGNLNAGTVPLARLSGSYNIDITGSSAFIFVNDTRSSVTGPQTGYRQVRADFLANSTDGLSDGGIYHGVLTFQQWADASGGGTRQLAFTDNDNLWIRGSGTGLTAYNAWKLMLNSVNFSSYALPLTGGTVTGQLVVSATTDPAILLSGGASADGTTHLYTSIGGVGKVRVQRNGIIAGLGLSIKSGTDVNGATEVFSVSNGGAVTGASFNGQGTGLTGTAANLTAGAVPWSGVTGKPTTLAGYGITDALNTSATAQTKSGNLTVNGALTSGGAFYAATTVQYSNRQPIYTLFHGGAQDLAWKKIADVTLGTGLYICETFKIDVVDNQSNFGYNSACFPMTYFVSCRRSGGVQDDYNDATVFGPVADYVRVVKTATGVYEIQIRQIADWLTHIFTVENTVGSGTVTYATGTPSNGSTTGTIYTATAGWTQRFPNLSVTSAATIGGTLGVTGVATFASSATFSAASGTYINTGGGSDAFGYNATSGYGHYIKGTGNTYIYGGGVFWDGSAIRTLLHSGTTSAPNLSIGGSAAQLNGQAASYYENRDTTAVGFSAGTLTLTRAAGNLTVSLDGRYLPLAGGTTSGAVTFGSTVVFGSSGKGRIYADWAADSSTRSFFAGRNSTDTDWNWGAEFGWDGANQRWYFDTVPFINGNAALHAGNYSSYALPLTGGTLTGALVGLAATFSGATNLSGGLTVSGSTHYVFNKPVTAGYQTVALFGTASAGLFLTTDSPIISTGAYYNNGWIATAASGTLTNRANGAYEWQTFSGATVGAAPTLVSRMTLSNAGVLNVVGSITQNGNQVVHAGNVSTYALPIGGGTLAGNLTINGHLTMGSGYQHRASDGSTAAPGYSFNADTDTGIHRSADNTLALVTGGAIRATVNSSGNLGVNVASALYRLQTDTAALFNRTAFGVLDISSNGSPNFIKIQTAIPFSYGSQAYTVNIRGFTYDGSQTVDITVCWHQYLDTFYNPTVSSSGSFAPTVRLARENSNVVICLTWGAKYWPKLYVESVHNFDLQAYSTGWSWSDADITGDKIVTLSYKNDWGGGMSKDSSGNLTVTGNITSTGSVTAGRIRGVNSLVLNTFTTVNPASNVFLYSQPNDRDAWIFLDSADTGSNWGIYHRQIDSAVSGLPANSIGFIGGGSSALQAWISLANGSANFQGALTQAGNQVLHAGNYIGSYIAPQTNYTTVVDASGYTWIRIPYAQGDSFNGGQSPIEFYVTRSIYDNSSTPYGGPTAKFVIQSMEWHSGQQMGTVQYGERGDSSSLGASNWITHAKVTNLSGGGYWVYLRLRTTTTAGVTYMFRRAAVGGQGINFSAIESTTDPGGAARLYYGFNLISAGTEARFYRDGNQVIDAGGFSGSLAVGYGSFASPGITLGDAQYGLYVTGGNLYYKSASGGVHYWRNIANSANTMSLDNSGNVVAAGSVTGTSFSGLGTGLTGTAASLSIGGNAATATRSNAVVYPFLNTSLDLNTTGGSNEFSAFNSYYPSGGSFNQPIAGGQHFRILQFGRYDSADSNFWRGQIAMSFYEDRMWFRRENAQTWQTWRELLHSGNFSSYALPLSGGTMTGQITGAYGPTLSFYGNACDAGSYNYVLGGANDGGNKLVVFVNGSTRTADGGVNAVTIRNDGGPLNLGLASYATNIFGSSITVSGALSATSFSGAGTGLTGTAASLTAGTATNATQLGGNAAANFVQGAGSRGRSTGRSNGTANSLTDPSGFYYGATVTGMPTTDWWHWIQSIGNDWSAPDGYGYQLACSYWSDDLRLRRLTSGTWGSWVQLLHSGNYSSYALPLSGGTLTGALSGTSASFSGALTSGGNSVLTVGNYSSYAVDNTKRVKQFFWDTISASTTQARRFEIARIAIDIVNWNQVGTFEIELSEQYWSNGLKKKYVVSYGYNSPRAVLKLVEMSGAGTNNFQVVLGSEQPVSGNHYYLPVYVDVRYYTYVDVRVTTSRQITANSTPPVGYTYINASPTPTNITDFGADSTVDISNAATAWQVGGNTIIHSGNYTSYPPARWATGRSISLTGDVTGTSGLFDGTANLSFAATLANSGVTAGTYRSVTVDAKGRVTSGTNPTTIAGYGITDALSTTGATMTGALNVTGVDQGLAIQHNGNTAAWFGRIITKNSTSDRAAFLGTYGTIAGVFAHNNALNAWADLYINTVDGSGGGTVRMPSSVLVNGNQVIHTGNYVSYSPSLTGGGASGTWGINISGSSASCSGNAATATNASQLNGQAGSYYENRSPTAVSISAGTLTITRAAGNLTTTIGGRVVAWCDFNGNFASSQTPNANFNVSSITKNATGDYTVNFSSALANANYVVAGTAQLDTPSPGQSNYNVMVAVPRRSGAKATGSCRIVCEYPAGVALYDSISVGVAFIAA